MTSSDDSLTTLVSAEIYLYRVGGPILIFIAYNLANLLYIYASLLSTTLSIGYQINSGGFNLPLCRLYFYVSILSNCASPFYLILATIDRILITSPNALTRQKSTRHLACISIGGGTLFWALFHSYTLMLANSIQVVFICYFEPGASLAFFSYHPIMKEMVALSLMIICGLWSVKNIRSTRRAMAAPDLFLSRADGVVNNFQSNSSKDRQMIIMLIIDVRIYTLFSFAYAISLIYKQIKQNYVKSYERIIMEGIVRCICLYQVLYESNRIENISKRGKESSFIAMN